MTVKLNRDDRSYLEIGVRDHLLSDNGLLKEMKGPLKPLYLDMRVVQALAMDILQEALGNIHFNKGNATIPYRLEFENTYNVLTPVGMGRGYNKVNRTKLLMLKLKIRVNEAGQSIFSIETTPKLPILNKHDMGIKELWDTLIVNKDYLDPVLRSIDVDSLVVEKDGRELTIRLTEDIVLTTNTYWGADNQIARSNSLRYVVDDEEVRNLLKSYGEFFTNKSGYIVDDETNNVEVVVYEPASIFNKVVLGES